MRVQYEYKERWDQFLDHFERERGLDYHYLEKLLCGTPQSNIHRIECLYILFCHIDNILNRRGKETVKWLQSKNAPYGRNLLDAILTDDIDIILDLIAKSKMDELYENYTFRPTFTGGSYHITTSSTSITTTSPIINITPYVAGSYWNTTTLTPTMFNRVYVGNHGVGRRSTEPGVFP